MKMEITSNKLLKVCGMRDPKNIQDIENLGTDLMGFIFYDKSKRFISKKPTYLPTNSKRVGVFVNETQEKIKYIVKYFQLDYIQLHGNETIKYCEQLKSQGVKIIKAFAINSSQDLSKTLHYESFCDYFLFDTPCSGYGGCGNSFNWSVLDNYKGDTPFWLSGGLSINKLKDLLQMNHPKLIGYDINSQFELLPGLKSTPLIHRFKSQLIKYNL